MFRLLIGPIIIGILVFLFILFISPFIVSEAVLVSMAAEMTLHLSNLYFDSMPPAIASIIAKSNLAVVALAAGLLTMLLMQLFAITTGIIIFVTKLIIFYLKRDRKKPDAGDLPPLEMDSNFDDPQRGKNVLGRGLDSIGRD